MTKKQRAKRVISNQVDPLRKDLEEYIDNEDKRAEALERLSKIEEEIRKLVAEPKTQDFYSDNFGGQF